MKIRTKALLTIIGIAIAITVLSLTTGLFSIQGGMNAVVTNDMEMFANMTSKLATGRLALLKSESRNIAERLLDPSTGDAIQPEQANAIIGDAARRYHYLSMVLFDPEHQVVAAYGDFVPDTSYAGNDLAQRAHRGEIVVSSTEIVTDGTLVIRVYTPVNKHLLIATLPGLIMSDLVSEFRILGRGKVFILDNTGAMVANAQPESVLRRYNLVEMAKDKNEHRYDDPENIFLRMTLGESGVGHYKHNSEERICSFMPIRGSDGWSVGVSAPESATSVSQAERVLLISGGIILFIAAIVAVFASSVIAKPFESLREMKQIAENASAAKSHFLARTSHEMRTPLNAIIGLSELALDDEKLPTETANNLEKIYGAGMTLLGIVNDLLDIAKIEAGKFEFIPTEYDVPSLINDTRSLNVLRIVEKPIAFQILVDETTPARLRGDELRVKQIFNNLLSNACKYTNEGTIEWSIKWEREGNDIWLISRIKDSGIGIKQEDIGKLFSDYAQVNAKAHYKVEGTGLGLSITKRIVEAMGGSISVESAFGSGSTFTVRFRQGFVTDNPIGPKVAESLRGFRYTAEKRSRNTKLLRIQLPYAKVLVVDDVPTNLDVAKGVMKPYGMRVDCVTSGVEAIDLIRTADVKYDAIFMDHMMPGMDGVEATRIIREEIGTEYAKTIPIIALTANAIVDNEKMFLENGFNAFMSKPIDVMRMDSILRQWVRDKERENEAGKENTKLASPDHETAGRPAENSHPRIEGIGWEAGLSRFGEDENVYLHIIRSYATNTTRLLEKVRSVTKQTLADYAILVHGIKGSSYSIEAQDVGKQAEALEQAAKAGDYEFVVKNNTLFIEATEKLLANLAPLLAPDDANAGEKSRRPAPDEALLDKMEEAAANFRIDALRESMAGLERFNYETQAELIVWLREQVNQMEFTAIRDRLAQRKQEAAH